MSYYGAYQYDHAEPEYCCEECASLEKRIEDIKYWLDGALHSLYHQTSAEILEHCLEELAGLLDMKLPAGELLYIQPQKQQSELNKYIEEWKEININHIKQITNLRY